MDGRAEKGYLKVKDVCRLIDVSPHTLRYWEKEFSEYLTPHRTPGGHRLYDDHTLRCALEIKHLLKVEMYSISGARVQLQKRYRVGSEMLSR